LSNRLELSNDKGLLEMSHVKHIYSLDFFYIGISLLAGNCCNSVLNRQPYRENCTVRYFFIRCFHWSLQSKTQSFFIERSWTESELNETNAIQ